MNDIHTHSARRVKVSKTDFILKIWPRITVSIVLDRHHIFEVLSRHLFACSSRADRPGHWCCGLNLSVAGNNVEGKNPPRCQRNFLFDFQFCLLSGAWPLIWWHIVYRLHHTRKSAETRLSCQDEKLGRIGMIPTPLPSLMIPTFYSVLLISFFIKHSERQIDIDTWLDSNWLLPPPSPERFPMCVSRFYHCC